MKISVSLVAMVFGAVGVTIASPTMPRTPVVRKAAGGFGGCTTDCWNEAAGSAGCDPNVDDECLCGPFFDDVASCAAALCNAGENLAALDFMEDSCN